MTPGDRIKERRKSLKISQRKLGEQCGISGSAIAQWETGQTTPSGESLLKVAAELDKTPSWILYGDSEHEKNAELEIFTQKVNEVILGINAPLYQDALRYLEHLKGISTLLKKHENHDV